VHLDSKADQRVNRAPAKGGRLAVCVSALLTATALTSGSSGSALRAQTDGNAPRVKPSANLHGHYPVAFLLCNFSDWHAEPNSIGFYKRLWTQQNPSGTFSSLADFFHDASYGQLDLKGSQVLGWFRMAVNPLTWYRSTGAINAQRISSRWLDCVNAAEASGTFDLGSKKFKAVVVVTPKVVGTIAGKGIAALPKLKPGQTTPPPETVTLKSTAGWPPAPFSMSIPTKGFAYGEDVRVSKLKGNTLTIYRGYNEGLSQQHGPFAALPPGGTVVPDTNDSFGYVGPYTVYVDQGAQPCTGPVPVPPNTFCPKVFLSKPGGAMQPETVHVGVANLVAGKGALQAGLGESAHEVGHATGYEHSRSLLYSTQDYLDCYDQMSYSCGLPGFPGEAGPRDGIVDYDAINLEFHGWLPSKAIYNLSNKRLNGQVTIRLHALSDPKALNDLGSKSTREYLDAQLPAKIKIEDVSPGGGPSIPPKCSGSGYHCATSRYYTVEYRQVYGFDQDFLDQGFWTGGVAPGKIGAVTLHLYAPDAGNAAGNISYLVNSYPGKKTKSGGAVQLPHNAALQPGDDYADPGHNVYIAVNAFDKSARTATVTLGGAKLKPKLVYSGARDGQTGHLVKLAATLTIDGAPVPDQPVRFTLADHHCGPSITDATGHAECQLTDPVSTVSASVGARITASFAGDSVYSSLVVNATFGGPLTPVKVHPILPPTTPTPTTTSSSTSTAVTVTTGVPMAYTFTLSTATQPRVISDKPAVELDVPTGNVSFTITNPSSGILSHNFKVCMTPLPGPITTLPKIQALPDDCTGESTPTSTPGGTPTTLTIDFTTPGAYEYLSTANNPDGDAFSGMKGVLNVT
jgi:hypothetical protein